MDNKDLRKHILPYWQDIYNLQYVNLFQRIYVRIKYRIFGNKFGSTEIPDNILEAYNAAGYSRILSFQRGTGGVCRLESGI